MAADYETAVFALYRYPPSLAAAIVAMIFFIFTTALHTYQMIRTRTTFFIPLVIGGYFEWVGYIGRVLNSRETPDWTLGPYIMQSVLLLVAPALFAATIYMTLGRIVKLCNGDNHLLVRPTHVTKTFVLGDVFSFLIQSTGAGYMAMGKKNPNALSIGGNIVIAGLFLQILFFGLFVAVAVIFHLRLNKDLGRVAQCLDVPWQKHMTVLYAASILILTRSIFRVVEYLQGNNGYIMNHEWSLYVFDAVLMLAVLVFFNFVHGSELKRLMVGRARVGNEHRIEIGFK